MATFRRLLEGSKGGDQFLITPFDHTMCWLCRLPKKDPKLKPRPRPIPSDAIKEGGENHQQSTRLVLWTFAGLTWWSITSRIRPTRRIGFWLDGATW